MATPGNTTTKLQGWLDLLRAGDNHARHELIGHACERLRRLTRRMLRSYPLVRNWEQTDDVLQNSMLRLYRALLDVRPQSLRHFWNLASLQIRRELLNLSKRHLRLQGEENSEAAETPADTDEPSDLLMCTEFHSQVDALPDDEKEVFDLIWYGELSQAEAAQVLGVSVRTVIRRWQSARIRLQQVLQGEDDSDGHD